MMRIAVCALTYLRPNGLQRLLEHLRVLEKPVDVELAIVIVDNDPAGSAADAVRRERDISPFDVVYRLEDRQSISIARNAAVSSAIEWGADFVAFIDDDEWPDPDWLQQLWTTHVSTGADVVTGPVFPVFDEPPPEWVIKGGFFERPRFEHNAEIPYATTSSVLITRACLEHFDPPFDPAFGLTGGSDTHFFAQLREAGYSIRWSDTAHVYESIPASRVSTGWLLRREYRRGQTLSRSLRRRDRRLRRLARRTGNAGLHLARGLGLLVLGLPRGRAHWLHGAKEIVLAAGMMTGLAGRQYREYRTIHGS